MSLQVAGALVAVLGATLVRWRRHNGRLDLDGCVLAPALSMLLVGITATALAIAGLFGTTTLSLACAGLAVALWPWRAPPTSARAAGASPTWHLAALGVVIIGAALLRNPPQDYALAGRDQGTYTLRAEHTVATGRIDLHDPLLADASAKAASRAGPGDILGLLPKSGEPWRRDLYEGAYRPGLYLADRERGHVVPQLFHLHPMLMACASLALGPQGPSVLVAGQSLLTLLALAAVGLRLWPSRPWALLPVVIVTLSPLAIWVQRSALSEVPAMVLLWSSALCVLRARDGRGDGLPLAALLLGGTAWARGHGLLIAPLVLAILWALPARRRDAVAIYGATVFGSLLVHAATAYPYLHDELVRMLPGFHPSPAQLVVFAMIGALVWDGVHRLLTGPGRDVVPRWVPRAPRWLSWAVVAAVLLWLGLRATSPPQPFARLDPLLVLLGPALLVVAACGLVIVARIRLGTTPSDVWVAALGVALVVPILLYARRNLPQGGLYYYGRYLVPEVLPIVALLATEALRRVHEGLALRRDADTTAGALAIALALSTGWPLLTRPATRINEFQGARRVVEAIAAEIPTGAVVIAGGEGWHNGHTFNQVGGALTLSHGIAVLPYGSREAAYATLHELLVADPDPSRPVFLLINEATKPYQVRDEGGLKTAAFDDLLDAPFVAARVEMFEMFVHRLTPVTDAVPTRVTRDELRMVLVEVGVDADLQDQIEAFAPPGSTIPRCLDAKKKTKLKLPPAGAAGTGPVALVIVASPGTIDDNYAWRIEVDGEKLAHGTVGGPRRRGDTLGPFLLPQRPTTLAVRGAKRGHPRARCPHGGIDAIRILPLPQPIADDTPFSVRSFSPTQDLGHPVQPIAWVSGRGLSRARPGITSTGGSLKAAGPALRLRSGQTLHFPLEPVPAGGTQPVDVIVTLSRSNAGEGAILELSWNGELAQSVAVPAKREGSWQSEPVRVEPTAPLVQVDVHLRTADGEGSVQLRDIGLFAAGASRYDSSQAPQ